MTTYQSLQPNELKGWLKAFFQDHQESGFSANDLQSALVKRDYAASSIEDIEVALFDLFNEGVIKRPYGTGYPGYTIYTYKSEVTPKYPNYIMEKVRQRLGLEPYDTSRDEQINSMSHFDVLDACLSWEGIQGYGYTIKDWIQDIYGVTLE